MFWSTPTDRRVPVGENPNVNTSSPVWITDLLLGSWKHRGSIASKQFLYRVLNAVLHSVVHGSDGSAGLVGSGQMDWWVGPGWVGRGLIGSNVFHNLGLSRFYYSAVGSVLRMWPVGNSVMHAGAWWTLESSTAHSTPPLPSLCDSSSRVIPGFATWYSGLG